jgi:hypothetical protein
MKRGPTSTLLGFSSLLLVSCARPSDDERAANTSPTLVGFGTAMADVARRFVLLGRASQAGRFELAEYQLGEIEEQFTETLPHASPPKEGNPEVLPGMVSAFVSTSIADLRQAIATRDHAQITAAFERTASACNACHMASGHAFIEVPLALGHDIPNTDPVAP